MVTSHPFNLLPTSYFLLLLFILFFTCRCEDFGADYKDVSECGVSELTKELQRKRENSIISRSFYIPKVEQFIHNRIVGGGPADVDEWPWSVALIIKPIRTSSFAPPGSLGLHFCGGTLISQTLVLTAAHCVIDKDATKMKVKVGEHDFGKDNETLSALYDVSKVTLHDGYVPETFENDIALLRISKKVEINRSVKPICLPSKNDSSGKNKESRQLDDETTAVVIGWGTTSFGGPKSSILREVDIKIENTARCARAYSDFNSNESKNTILPTMLCAGDNGKDSCQGDSGGPLNCRHKDSNRWELCGITSFGFQCSSALPGVYTKVDEYLDWLEEVTSPPKDKTDETTVSNIDPGKDEDSDPLTTTEPPFSTTQIIVNSNSTSKPNIPRLGHIGYLETVYDKTCTDHIGRNINFKQARVNCLKDAKCIGIDRQNIVRSRACGNSIVKLCRKFALRGTCDCSSPGCNPTDCNRFKADKVTCIHRKDVCTSSLECIERGHDFCNLVYEQKNKGYCVRCADVEEMPAINENEFKKHCSGG